MSEQALVIDMVGRMCPLPVIELAKRIGDVPIGSVVAVVSDDPSAATDIPAWCRMRGHDYVGAERDNVTTSYLVRRTH